MGAVGAIHVPDRRLDILTRRFRPQKKTPIEIRVHDLCPSLEPSFPTAEIEAMKRMDVLLCVLPGFTDASEQALIGELNSLLGELCLQDLLAVERRLERARKEKLEDIERGALEVAREALNAEGPVRLAPLSDVQRQALRGYALITERPMIALVNLAEDAVGTPAPAGLRERAEACGMSVQTLCATLEAEMAELPADERAAFLAEYGVSESTGSAVTRSVLECGDIIPFFTVGEDECRAWPIARGTSAREAAGKIHSDIARGFIRAEVVAFDDLEPLQGGLTEARKLGKLRLEGKDYVIRDGEIVHFRFNV